MTMKFSTTHPLNRALLFLSMTVGIGALHAQNLNDAREPLAPRLESYISAAKGGDRATASKLFQEANECLAMQRVDDRTSALQRDKHSVLNDPNGQRGEEAQMLERMEGAQRRADASRVMCEGTETQITNEKIYDIALTAAKLGDAAATACFIASPWPVETKDIDPSKALQYRDEAETLEDRAIEKGDWRVVQAMAIATSGNAHGGYAFYIQKQDFPAQLRYNKLLRLGATTNSDEAKNLDISIEALSARVSAVDVAKADVWARSMYARYYSTVPHRAQSAACDA
jgi:hypothetical protein